MKFFKRKKQAEANEASPEAITDSEQGDDVGEAPVQAAAIEPREEAPPAKSEEVPVVEAAQADAPASEAADDEQAPVAESAVEEEKPGFLSRLGLRRKKPVESDDSSAEQAPQGEQPEVPADAPVPESPAAEAASLDVTADAVPPVPVTEQLAGEETAEAAAAQAPVETQQVDTPSPESPLPVTEAEVLGSEVLPQEEAPPEKENAAVQEKTGFFSRLRRGLGRTSDNLVQGLGNLFLGRKEIDDALFEELESRLLMADVGIDATLDIIQRLTKRVSRKELTRPEALHAALREELLALLQPCEQPLDVSGHQPYVILMVGVNGVGKTTTIGKLAKHYMEGGRSVMLAAGDTFRAAAVEQLQVWGERNDVPVVAQHTGADSASVLFDALQAARARKVDVLIADTAGRLHNKDNLMEELKKVVRVMGKIDPSAPHEVMLVLDAGTGQNALAQAENFQQWVGVTGISLTKLDGTGKGGIIFAIAKKLQLPIRFIGVGEAVEDLRPFQAEQFIEALFDVDNASA